MNNNITTIPAKTPTLVEIRCDKLRYPRLVRVPRELAEGQIRECIMQGAMLRGQEMAPETLRFAASALLDELLRDEEGIGLKYITIEEIRREIKAAALGSRGELYGINVSSLYRVLRDYALGAGHEAEETVRRCSRAALEQAMAETPAGIAITTAAGALANAFNARKQ